MSAVPSLVGVGTVVAAAAVGLLIGQSTDTPPPSTSNKRKLTTQFGVSVPSVPQPTLSRPATSAAASPSHSGADGSSPSAFSPAERPPTAVAAYATRQARLVGQQTAQVTPPKVASRRHSFIRPGDYSVPTIAEHGRDSLSSNGSWMRRLSVRPISQHGSARSSIFGLDSPSLNISLGSAGPMLGSAGSLPPQLPPNKLVKRATQIPPGESGSLSRRGSRSQMPTLRRPATSHQRSATMQHYQPQDGPVVGSTRPLKYSFEQQGYTQSDAVDLPSEIPEDSLPDNPAIDPAQDSTVWTSFFHSRVVKPAGGTHGSHSHARTPSNSGLPAKRLLLQPGHIPHAVLIQPARLSTSTHHGVYDTTSAAAKTLQKSPPAQPAVREAKNASPAADEIPSKRVRRSLSMRFSSPSTWISKTGSIRRSKRGGTLDAPEGKRYVSAPVRHPATNALGETHDMEDVFMSDERVQVLPYASHTQAASTRRRNASSPLPPLSRLSSFNVDLNRLGASSPSPISPTRLSHAQSYAFKTSQTSPVVAHHRGMSGERTFTMISSDQETRDLGSADEDDLDFKSDTMFDSFRTNGSSRLKSVETPLESMFDESPPSTAGNTKTKRLSIQEILGHPWDGAPNIMEEDEGLSTPVRDTQPPAGSAELPRISHDGDGDSDFNFSGTTLPVPLPARDFGRLSIDDEEAEDWACDDGNALSNHLSPPSTVNSRGSSHRMALANISGNGGPEDVHESFKERPHSKLFEWSEPSAHDKSDPDGSSSRPKTVHGQQQEMELRGGRSANRKVPTATHIRSQSVPVIVADAVEPSKPAQKFGTWGLSSKTASEDWDDEFDFGSVAPPIYLGAGPSSTESASLVVPASIQAAQGTVKAHSGQIREFSLLVNDLKRLCRHGRDLGLLDNHGVAKWEEAENIIALASPDEEQTDGAADEDMPPGPNNSTSSPNYLVEGFGPMSLNEPADLGTARQSSITRQPAIRRRSVFSPEDDIFGSSASWSEDDPKPSRPRTPVRRPEAPTSDTAVIASVMEAIQQQRSASESARDKCPSQRQAVESKLFFDTNSLQELVKRASYLRDTLSDIVRRAESFTHSPMGTPRRERHKRQDSSPAFTKVFANKQPAHAMTVQ